MAYTSGIHGTGDYRTLLTETPRTAPIGLLIRGSSVRSRDGSPLNSVCSTLRGDRPKQILNLSLDVHLCACGTASTAVETRARVRAGALCCPLDTIIHRPGP